MSNHIDWGDLNETVYGSSFLIGVEDGSKPMRNITLLALMSESGCLTNNDGAPYTQSHINGIKSLAVVWKYVDDEINVDHIYDHDTGEIYWDYDHACADWSDGDEKLYSSILMWANLESVIGGN